MGLRGSTWMLLSNINKNNKNSRRNTAIISVRSLRRNAEEVAIDVELELELTEDKQ
ncbi:hypothetical protein JCM16161A_14110 [Vulcanisaeta sp. JCM 16161]